MPLPESLTPEQLCKDFHGSYNSTSKTCVLESQAAQSTLQPQCRHSCAQNVFTDEYGSCYSFERLPNNVFRQEYRLNDVCWSKLNNFFSTCADKKEVGICTNVQSWMHDKGRYIEPAHPIVEKDVEQLSFQCRPFLDKGSCETAVCSWSERADIIPKPITQSKEEFELACGVAEGEYDAEEKECIVPKCSPLQTPFSAYN